MERYTATIIKNGVQTHKGQFTSETDREAWLAKHIAKNTFGLSDIYELQNVVVQPAILGEEGDIVQEAVIEEQNVLISACEYTVVLEDIGEQLERQRVNRESRAYLDSTDWYLVRFVESGTPVPTEITQARAAARASIID